MKIRLTKADRDAHVIRFCEDKITKLPYLVNHGLCSNKIKVILRNFHLVFFLDVVKDNKKSNGLLLKSPEGRLQNPDFPV